MRTLSWRDQKQKRAKKGSLESGGIGEIEEKKQKEGKPRRFLGSSWGQCCRDSELKVKVRIVWLATWKLYL